MDVNKKGCTTPFINNLEIDIVFKDEDGKEKVSVMDFINQVLQLLKVKLKELVNMAWDMLRLIELYNSKRNYITELST